MEAKDKNIKVVFKNEPKLSEHEVQKNMNERRINLVPQVKDYVANNPRFKDKDVSITFVQKGQGSLVSILETTEEKLVLKIRLQTKNNSEAIFLDAWEAAGVKVPHVFERGLMSGHDYMLMEYVDSPTLGDVFSSQDILEKNIYSKMGSLFSHMHEAEAKGYGEAVNGKAEFEKFTDWAASEGIKKKIDYVKENKLLGDEHGSLKKAIQILSEYTERENKSSYCHGDFGAHNIFYTDPLTVFDPNPMFNNRYIDLGENITGAIGSNGLLPEQFISGYFNGEEYDKKVLCASILLNAYLKIWRAHRIHKITLVQNLQKYLIDNKHLLD